MRLISFLISILFLFSGCSPKDDVREGGNGPSGGIQLKSGSILNFDKKGERVGTCGFDDPEKVWTSVRLHQELSYLFPEVKDLKVVVSKGANNCNKIGSRVQIQTKSAEGWDDSGVFLKVKAVLVLNEQDFYTNKFKKLFELTLEGMMMTEAQMKAFLDAPPNKAQINVVFFESDEDSSGDDDSEPLPVSEVEFFSLPDFQGQTASECKNNWNSIQVYSEAGELVKRAIEEGRFKAYVSHGDKSCLVIGEGAAIEIKKEGILEGVTANIESVTFRNKSDFLADPILASYVARDMGMSVDEFFDHLKNINRDKVNVTRFTLEAQ